MALIKDKEKFGVLFSYWKVSMFTANTDMQEVNFSLNLYLNKDATEFVDTYCVDNLMGVDDKTLYNKYFANDRGETYKDWQTACYMYAKENIEFFKDAVDDIDENIEETKEDEKKEE